MLAGEQRAVQGQPVGFGQLVPQAGIAPHRLRDPAQRLAALDGVGAAARTLLVRVDRLAALREIERRGRAGAGPVAEQPGVGRGHRHRRAAALGDRLGIADHAGVPARAVVADHPDLVPGEPVEHLVRGRRRGVGIAAFVMADDLPGAVEHVAHALGQAVGHDRAFRPAQRIERQRGGVERVRTRAGVRIEGDARLHRAVVPLVGKRGAGVGIVAVVPVLPGLRGLGVDGTLNNAK